MVKAIAYHAQRLQNLSPRHVHLPTSGNTSPSGPCRYGVAVNVEVFRSTLCPEIGRNSPHDHGCPIHCLRQNKSQADAHHVWMVDAMEKIIEKIPELVGTGNSGSVMATVTALQADTEGAEKGQLACRVSSRNCCWGDVRKRKPTRKSPTRSEAWLAPMEAKEPPSRLSRWACVTFQCSPLVAPPSTICEAFEAAVSGVMSVTPAHWTARKEKKNAKKTESRDIPTGISNPTPRTTQQQMMQRSNAGNHIHHLISSWSAAESFTMSEACCFPFFSSQGDSLFMVFIRLFIALQEPRKTALET
ncbi:hypothetical protein KC333_g175 [Hortaea werneckii]|nr:hypothetical protein KC333_g175 [Hortaea werneckii]